MNLGFVGFVLVAAAFLWLIGATIWSPARKTTFGLALLGLIVGLLTGFLIAWQWYIPELRNTLGGKMRWIQHEPVAAAMISYTALNKLESGNEAEAKSFLANQVMRFYHALKKTNQLSPEEKKCLDTLESGIAKSEALRQSLQDNSR